MADVRVKFVLPNDATDESDASPIMVQAYESCKQLVNNISWVKEADLATMTFNKLDYLVFERFEGKDFSRYIESKCVVLGPMAISVCLMECKPIPSFPSPILNVAMYGCEVTCSQLSRSEKEKIKKKVELMGGLYRVDFLDSTTHLVCDGTKSEKYMRAAEAGAKIMLPSWVDHVFEISQSQNVTANDPKILEKFYCPPFHRLTICSTGIATSTERQKLAEIISLNGGTLVAKLALSKTDILICHGASGTTSDKYKAARKTETISCVTLEWVLDSVKRGYALPHETYRVKTVTSTPTKEGENIDPNFSTISAIGGSVTLKPTHINDTVDATRMIPPSADKRGSNKRKADDALVENIDIKKVKNAGSFLDGCSVFVAGFSPPRRDKLNKIINISGATRYDDFSERVTHVIVGDPTCPEITSIRAMGAQCCIVSVQWLLDSVDQQKPADEEKYLVIGEDSNATATNIASPLSQKVISFLRGDNVGDVTSKVTKTKAPENDDPLTQKYLKNATNTEKGEEEDTLAKLLNNQDVPLSFNPKEPEEFNIRTRPLSRKNNLEERNQTLEFRPQDTSTQLSQVTTDLSDNDTLLPIFNSLKFILDGFDEENMDMYTNYIVECGGAVTDKRFRGIADYAVFPVVYKQTKVPPVQEVVNVLWLVECIENKSLQSEIQYYHRPIELSPACPLRECVITISGYTGEEREFLKALIEGLGGVSQELFSRKISKANNVLASTHLISSEPNGKKYDAALRWNLPVTSKEWLLECAKTGKKPSVQMFLIGESKCTEIDNAEDSNRKNDTTKNITGLAGEIDESNQAKQSVSTPKAAKASVEAKATPKTPADQIYNLNRQSTPGACSQVTPINKILQDAINNKVLPTPPSPKTYYPWDPKTPDTPIGAFIRPNPSPRLRKEMQKYVNSFPEFVPPKRRLSTPLSELKKRLMDKVLCRGEYSQSTQEDALGPSTSSPSQTAQNEMLDKGEFSDDDKKTTEEKQPSIENIAVHQKLQELQQKVMASGSSSATRRSSRMFETSSNLPGIEKTNVDVQSQVFTVGWDYEENKTQDPRSKVFMLSGIESVQRELLANQLKDLGAEVLLTNDYDTSTHLVCPKAGRNEKTLACMASGKWILHVSYVEKSVAAGHFLNEEEFEFGNPKARSNIFYEEKDNSVFFWRKEINRRGYGAFNDMRAIVVAEKKEPIARVIEAGGGIVLNISPPFDDSIHATHCLLEIRSVKDISKYVVLAQQGIKCVNTIYLNDFLWRNKKDDSDYIVPYFSKYYK